MLMMFSRLLLKLSGWKIFIDHSYLQIPRAVVIMAPHTSMMDFWIGRLAFWKYRKKVHFLIKRELFFFPVGIFLKWMGGIPVRREHTGNLVEQLVDEFSKRSNMWLVITPEGTRKKVEKWKTGFYKIALAANIPILVSYIDYARKEGGIAFVMYPTGDFEKDFEKIKDFYKTVTAKYPEQFNLSSMYMKQEKNI